MRCCTEDRPIFVSVEPSDYGLELGLRIAPEVPNSTDRRITHYRRGGNQEDKLWCADARKTIRFLFF